MCLGFFALFYSIISSSGYLGALFCLIIFCSRYQILSKWVKKRFIYTFLFWKKISVTLSKCLRFCLFLWVLSSDLVCFFFKVFFDPSHLGASPFCSSKERKKTRFASFVFADWKPVCFAFFRLIFFLIYVSVCGFLSLH